MLANGKCHVESESRNIKFPNSKKISKFEINEVRFRIGKFFFQNNIATCETLRECIFAVKKICYQKKTLKEVFYYFNANWMTVTNLDDSKGTDKQ